MRHYKVTDITTNVVILRYADITEVQTVTNMNTSNMAIYCDSETPYKGQYLIEYDYADKWAEEWEKICSLLRGEPIREPKIEFRSTLIL